MNKNWYRSKTIWAGIAGVITAIGGGLSGEMTTAQAIQVGLTALIGIFLRMGIK